MDNACRWVLLILLYALVTDAEQSTEVFSGNKFTITPVVNNRTGLTTAAIVTSVNLLTLNKEEIRRIQKLVTEYSIVVFKDQGILREEEHRKIGSYFGSVDGKHHNFKGARLQEINVVSNDKDHGLTGVGSRGWHIDGYFFHIPHSYVVYHMVNVTKEGPTMFVPLTDMVAALPEETRALWDRVWIKFMTSRGEITHPFIYKHPSTGKNTICIHFDYIHDIVFDLGTPHERHATGKEVSELTEAWALEFDKGDGYWHYLHYWEQGDVVITDNRAVAHQAHPDATKSANEIGLRVLHRACVQGEYPPMKALSHDINTNFDRDEL